MDVSVIIVNYNTLRLTSDCIDSIFEHTQGVSFEVILIDNASTDGSVEHFSGDKRITFVASPTNLGFGRANNLGYQHAKGKYIFLLNSDTLLKNDALTLFYQAMETLPEKVGCVGAMLKDGENKPCHSYQSLPTIWETLLCFICIRLLPSLGTAPLDKEKPFRVGSITGADLFIRRSVIEECGFFDEEFFMYYEETELQYRFQLCGYESWIVHKPEIIHLESGSQRHLPNMNKRIISLRSALLYHKKTNNRFMYRLFQLLLLVGSLHLLFLSKYTMAEKIRYFKAVMR